jgi:hypothetical protein
VQACSVPTQRRIAILSCLLLPSYQEAEPRFDVNFLSLWRGAERLLVAQFPDARVLTTTAQDRHYQREDYVAFLAVLGYQPRHAALREFIRPL